MCRSWLPSASMYVQNYRCLRRNLLNWPECMTCLDAPSVSSWNLFLMSSFHLLPASPARVRSHFSFGFIKSSLPLLPFHASYHPCIKLSSSLLVCLILPYPSPSLLPHLLLLRRSPVCLAPGKKFPAALSFLLQFPHMNPSLFLPVTLIYREACIEKRKNSSCTTSDEETRPKIAFPSVSLATFYLQKHT